MAERFWRKTIAHPAMRGSIEIQTGDEEPGYFLRNMHLLVIDTYDPDGQLVRRSKWVVYNGSPKQILFLGRWPGVRKCFCGAVLGTARASLEDHRSREHA